MPGTARKCSERRRELDQVFTASNVSKYDNGLD